MENAAKEMMRLITSEITGEKVSSNYDEKELSELYVLSKSHDMAHLVGSALKKNGLLEDGENKKAFEKAIFTAVYRNGKMVYELENIKKCLSEKNIPFILLKGAVLMDYYPESWMRTSSDIDVLVHYDDLLPAADALAALFGCSYKPKGSHDIQFVSNNGVHVELHYRLVEENCAADAEKPLAKVWEHAVKKGGTSECALTEEMFYYYHIAHMAKHIMNGGCGIRPLLDLYILNGRKAYNEKKEEKLLSEGGLLTFNETAKSLTLMWFGEGEETYMAKKLGEYLVLGGIYGNMDNKVLFGQTKRGGGKLKYALTRIWLPYEKMRFFYPTLDGKKALLPVYEVIRWFRLIFLGGFKRSINELKINSEIDKESAGNAKELLEGLGLVKKK